MSGFEIAERPSGYKRQQDAALRFLQTMRRSTNGGGENSPLLVGEDDYYELFLEELAGM